LTAQISYGEVLGGKIENNKLAEDLCLKLQSLALRRAKDSKKCCEGNYIVWFLNSKKSRIGM
jgi:hypothetical protein